MLEYEMYFEIKTLCEEYYSKRKMEHAKAVEKYTMQDTRYALLPAGDKWTIRAIALAHDLLEDTDCTYEDIKTISCYIAESVLILTHYVKNMSYYDYCSNIIESGNYFAVIVKTADLKDHLTRKKTLSEKLQKKYAAVIPMFLKA